MVVGISCDNKGKEEHPDQPVDPPAIKDDGINYVKNVKHVRTFAAALAPVTKEYDIVYAEPDSEGRRNILQVRITSGESNPESRIDYTYTYDDGNLLISAAFEEEPDKKYAGDFKFNPDGTIKRFALLQDNTYSYYPYSYDRQKKLSSNANKPFDLTGGFWDIQWEEGNATAMMGATRTTRVTEETASVREKIECTFAGYETNYSIDINGLLEDFMHHNFNNPVMPLFPGMTCRNLVSGISAEVDEYVYSTEMGAHYTRYIESSVYIDYETDEEGRIVKMRVKKESEAVKQPAWIDGDTYSDIPHFNYTDLFEFTY